MVHGCRQLVSGKPYSDIYPEFRGIVDNLCEDLPYEEVAADSDLVITALPHGVSAKIVPDLLKAGAKVIDHSGDFRYKDLATYEKSYGLTHPNPELLKDAVYGLPEFYREQLKTAVLVANPGCYPTCSLVALAPFLKEHLIEEDSIIIDATSGVSGAGRKADLAYAFCELDESFKPYGAVGHRHTTEIAEQCSFLAGKNPGDIKVTFTPHLAPFKRGMLASVYAKPSSAFALPLFTTTACSCGEFSFIITCTGAALTALLVYPTQAVAGTSEYNRPRSSERYLTPLWTPAALNP